MKLRLSFEDRDLEEQFQADLIKDSRDVLRTAVVLGISLYALFAILDIYALPETKYITWVIRFAFVIPVLVFIFWAMSKPFYSKYAHILMSISSIVAGYGIVAMIAFSTQNELGFLLYYAGLMLVIIWNYTLLRISLRLSMIIGWLIVIGYEVVAIVVQKLYVGGFNEVDFVIFLSNTFFLVSSNILGSMSGYVFEKQIRQSFLHRQVIREEKEKVERRTKALKEAQKKLLETSRQAGMAEIATGVVHNIGNVVNSANIATTRIIQTLKNSKIDTLHKTNLIVKEHEKNLTAYMTQDEKGKLLPSLFFAIEEAMMQEHRTMMEEAEVLNDRIREIINTIEVQSRYASSSHVTDEVNLYSVVEKALLLFQDNLAMSHIRTSADVGTDISVHADESRLLHILIGLFTNARDALMAVDKSIRILKITSQRQPSGDISLDITDNGEGIPEELLESIFNYGFTTRKNRNGFGLHLCANFMTEMGGKIHARSSGQGQGATFTLLFPLVRARRSSSPASNSPRSPQS